MLKVLKSNCIAVFLLLIGAVVTQQKSIGYKRKEVEIAREPLDSIWMAPRFFTDQVTAGVGGTLQRILVLGALCCNFPMA